MAGYDEIFVRLSDFAQQCEMVRAMVLFGSRARRERPADEFSDYDLMFFVTDVDYFVNTDEWLKNIADFHISFVEGTAVQDYERRVFFDDAMDMDFIFYNADDMAAITADPIIRSWFAKGYRIIVDKADYAAIAEKCGPFVRESREFSEKEFINTVSTFWFHAVWSAKKLCRGEIWAAKGCIDGYMKNLLREILEYDAAARNGADFDTWHDGRFFDSWADKSVLPRLGGAYGSYDKVSLYDALMNTMALFAEKARDVSRAMSFSYPSDAEEYAFSMLIRFDSKK